MVAPQFGQKKQQRATPPPPPQLSFQVFWRCLMIRYVAHYSCLLIEKSQAVTSSTYSSISSSLPSSTSSSSLPFHSRSHDVVSLSESGCAVLSQICCWSEAEKITGLSLQILFFNAGIVMIDWSIDYQQYSMKGMWMLKSRQSPANMDNMSVDEVMPKHQCSL